jgi:excinuclease ABC subunit C
MMEKPLPPEILLSHPVSQKDLLEAALSGGQEASKKVRLVLPEKGARRRLVEFAVKNAHDALGRNLLERKNRFYVA